MLNDNPIIVTAQEKTKDLFEASGKGTGSFNKSPLEEGETLNSFKELLDIVLGIEVCIVILLIFSLVILIFINISKRELYLGWTVRIPFGGQIKKK